jgi:hypothetical protein
MRGAVSIALAYNQVFPVFYVTTFFKEKYLMYLISS